MVLSSFAIKELLENRKLVIEPLDSEQIQPASIDLRISDEILIAKGEEIDFGKEPEYERIKANEVVLPPKTHVLVRTRERVELPNDVGGITKLRSSLSRIGLMFNNAGWVDPGFKGTLTLSVFNPNDSPVKIKAGTRFFQLLLVRLDRESEGYSGKYLGQREITGSREHSG
ncbi:MAG: dCTP deaminase [Candidatus Aenigmarchaeota archaeon]|nr:dCTP deaminase [Candidatus Aenigmarchaeota archaeon]NIQ18049.1 dCTP deaminase [Candidatus Aenigmarchaeota archaeon]